MEQTQQQERVANNILIAEFMGWEYVGYAPAWNHPEDKGSMGENDFKYHKSWDALIPVVEKIDEEVNSYVEGNYKSWGTDYRTIISGYNVVNMEKDEVYKAIIEFIKWYNKNEE